MTPPSATAAQDMVTRASVNALRAGLDQLVRRNLRGVWVRGVLPTGSAVWASNHHSWWDYFAAAAALRAAGRQDVDVMMQPENIAGKTFRAAGAIGTDQIRRAIETLRSGRILVIFPEGELRTAGALGATRPGAQWLARTSGASMLIVATRVVMRGHQAPEAFIDVAHLGDPATTDYETAHRAHLAQLDQALLAADPEQPLADFRKVVAGSRDWNERFGSLRNGTR